MNVGADDAFDVIVEDSTDLRSHKLHSLHEGCPVGWLCLQPDCCMPCSLLCILVAKFSPYASKHFRLIAELMHRSAWVCARSFFDRTHGIQRYMLYLRIHALKYIYVLLSRRLCICALRVRPIALPFMGCSLIQCNGHPARLILCTKRSVLNYTLFRITVSERPI